jgi:imidazolonepropionase
LAKLADYVDMFVDEGYFTVEDAAVLLKTARELGIPSKFHCDELQLTGGTEFAVNHGSLSCDHLLKIGEREIKMLAQSETTATLLPTTAFFLKTPYAPARQLLDAGARVALASDFNPGTSPTQDISIVGALSALQMGMRIDEILVALTLNGAYALGLQTTKGALLPGFDADFLMIESESPAALFYDLGARVAMPEVYVSGRHF